MLSQLHCQHEADLIGADQFVSSESHGDLRVSYTSFSPYFMSHTPSQARSRVVYTSQRCDLFMKWNIRDYGTSKASSTLMSLFEEAPYGLTMLSGTPHSPGQKCRLSRRPCSDSHHRDNPLTRPGDHHQFFGQFEMNDLYFLHLLMYAPHFCAHVSRLGGDAIRASAWDPWRPLSLSQGCTVRSLREGEKCK